MSQLFSEVEIHFMPDKKNLRQPGAAGGGADGDTRRGKVVTQ
jgi:hypothetical protein